MRATQQLQYAVYGIFDLAYNGRDEPVRVREIGERHRIPPRYLEQIFQRLRRAGLVESKRGPGGGYVLARSPEEIRVIEVVEAVDGTLLRPPERECDEAGESPAFVWEMLRGVLIDALAPMTIAELCREAARRGVERAETAPPMYEI